MPLISCVDATGELHSLVLLMERRIRHQLGASAAALSGTTHAQSPIAPHINDVGEPPLSSSFFLQDASSPFRPPCRRRQRLALRRSPVLLLDLQRRIEPQASPKLK